MKRRLIVVPLIRSADGRYLFIIYACTADGRDPVINEEFDAFAWIEPDECDRYDMNEETRITLRQVGVRTQ